MNFLKSVLSSSAGPPGVTLGERVVDRWYTLYDGVRRDGGVDTPCSCLHFELGRGARHAQNYLSRIRALRHPGVVRYLASHETSDALWIVTERVRPVAETLTAAVRADKDRLYWGLWQIAETMRFVNGEAASVHGNLCLDAIFVDEAGEWKLGGFECLSSMRDATPAIATLGTTVPDGPAPIPSDLPKGYGDITSYPITAVDAWQYGHLFSVLFNGTNDVSAGAPGKIPRECATQWRRLLSPPKQRLSIADFVEHGRRQGGWFRSRLIEVSEQVGQLALRPRSEVEAFLREHLDDLARLPTGYTTHKVLPEIIKSLEFGGGGAAALDALLVVAAQLSDADGERLVQPAVLRLWSSQDRALRLLLLERVAAVTTHITDRQVNDRVLPAIEASLGDAAPALRERALLAAVEVLPRLSDRNVNGSLLKNLAKTANDREPGIRTNTTVCLAKVAPRVDARTRGKVLAAALSRAVKDPFPPARDAALRAAAATAEEYDGEQLAGRMLPAVVSLLLDPEGDVRRQAKRTVDVLMARCAQLAETMPETLLPPEKRKPTESGTATPQADTSAKTGGWASWAVSNLSKNLDSLAVADAEAVRSTSSTPSNARTDKPAPIVRAPISRTTSQTQVSRPTSTPAQPRGLKLEKKQRQPFADVQPPIISSTVAHSDADADAWDADAWELDEPVAPPRATPKKTKAAADDDADVNADVDADVDAWDAGW